MKKILVTSIGSFSADIIIKKLHENGYFVVGTDIYPKEWVVDAQNVDEFYKIPAVRESKNYIESLLYICKKNKINYIFPLIDVEIDILNKYRNIFEEISVTVCISAYEAICVCRNKRETEAALTQAGVCKTITSYSNREIKDRKLSFPVVCKPIDGRSSQGLKIFENKEIFFEFYGRIDADKYLIQPYIAGNIITVDVVRNEATNNCVAIARKELLRTLNGAGLCVQIFKDEELERLCMKVAEILNINGCANFEFIESEDGKRYFLECNPRFSGGVEFSVMSGYDCIMNHLRCFEGKDIETKINIKEYCVSRKYEEYITALNAKNS